MNDILIELCERKSYEKTKKMLEKAKGKCGMLQRLDNFIKSLKEASGKEEENAKPKSKLSFDINIDEEDSKMIIVKSGLNKKERIEYNEFLQLEFCKIFNPTKTKKRKLENVTPLGINKKKRVPAEFVQQVLSLGFNKDDAPRLYEDKANWMGISSGGKVLCTIRGCKFQTPIASDELFEHCRVKHQWKDYPCPEDNCKYIAYCIMALKRHSFFHSNPPTTQYQFHCSKNNCNWTFGDQWNLQRHENTHDNILLKCIYCPYTCVRETSFLMHQREHFNIRDYKCEYCNLKVFKSQGELNKHFNNYHSGITTKCFKCDYEGSVQNVRVHLNSNHKLFGYRWDANNAKFVKM